MPRSSAPRSSRWSAPASTTELSGISIRTGTGIGAILAFEVMLILQSFCGRMAGLAVRPLMAQSGRSWAGGCLDEVSMSSFRPSSAVRDVGNEVDHSSRGICVGSSVSSPTNPETDTPSSLTAFFIGKSALNNSAAKSLRLQTAPANVRLREISSKSANFTFRVTVRPRVFHQSCRSSRSSGPRRSRVGTGPVFVATGVGRRAHWEGDRRSTRSCAR
jgi:hypothetical protein